MLLDVERAEAREVLDGWRGGRRELRSSGDWGGCREEGIVGEWGFC